MDKTATSKKTLGEPDPGLKISSGQATIGPAREITLDSARLKRGQFYHALAIQVLPLMGVGVAVILATRTPIPAISLYMLCVMYGLTILGITVGFHRHFAHGAFQAVTPVRLILAILGSMACQGPVIYWVSNHRRHHQFSDRAGDPHSPYVQEDSFTHPLKGFWHAHVGWMFNHRLTNTVLFAKDLLQDPLVTWVNRTYYGWVVLGFLIPASVGWIATNSMQGALTGFLMGGLVRVFLTLQATSCINSITHLYGLRTFKTAEYSTNNPWLALPVFGEGWHNNHHAFPHSAIFGLEWWQVDTGGWLIRGLELLGLAWNVKRPTSQMVAAKSRE